MARTGKKTKKRTTRLAGQARGESAAVRVSVGEVRKRLGVPRKTFSRILAVSERSLADVEKGSRPASEAVRRRATEVERLRQALAEVVDEGAIAEWLDTPNAAFDNLKPLEVIERGEIDRLWRMIYLLRSGEPS